MELSDFIHGNSFRLVEHYIETNGIPKFCTAIPYVLEYDDDGEETVGKGERFSANSKGEKAAVSFIHQAVRNCYENPGGLADNERCSDAVKILDLLIKNGAALNKTCSFLACSISGYQWKHFRGTPIEFSVFLKSHSSCSNEEKAMREVIDVLYAANQTKSGLLKCDNTSVPIATQNIWSSLLSDEQFNDVQIKCKSDDGDTDTLPAHKAVLAASSPYFRTMFTGPWAENTDNTIVVPYSKETMQILLKYIYTGDLEKGILKARALDLLGLSIEYCLPELQKHCEYYLMSTLSIDNIVSVLKLSKLYSTSDLIKACFEFIKKNAVVVLTHPAVISLAQEQPEFWSQIVEGIGGSKMAKSGAEGANKKQKTEH